MLEITVTAGAATPTTTGIEGAVDVTFCLSTQINGRELHLDGEVTLCPAEDGRPQYTSWGEIDMWLDGATVTRLRERDTNVQPHVYAAEMREILDAIEGATADSAGRP